MSINREIFPSNRRISSYKIVKMIGRGSYGDVYLVTDSRNMKNYAMKTESINAEKQTLNLEVDLLFGTNVAYFPAIRGFGEESDCRYYVMDVLGPPLSKILRRIRKNSQKSQQNTKESNKYISNSNPEILNSEEKLYQINNQNPSNLIHSEEKPNYRNNVNSKLTNSSEKYLNLSLINFDEKTNFTNMNSNLSNSNEKSNFNSNSLNSHEENNSNSNSDEKNNFFKSTFSNSNNESMIDLRTFYTIAEETLKILEYLHTQLGIVHRDIKPSNFLLRPNSNSPLCLVDFGLAKRYIDKTTNRPIPASTSKRFTGTIRYASPNAHEGLDLSPRDDLYSWFYMMLEIKRNGKLPWDKINDRKESLEMKKRIYLYDNCDELPERFASIYRIISGLTYDSMPDYARIFSLLKCAEKNDNVDLHPKSKKKKYKSKSGGLKLNDVENYDETWSKLMNIIPEALEIVPNETEQLKNEFIHIESERWKTSGSVYGLESPLIDIDDHHCSENEGLLNCPCTIF